jgi:flagellar basal body-associated protein FliL
MKKIILIAVVAVVLLGGGIGGTFFYLSMHHAKTASKLPPPPKPIYFAQLADMVVTVPADTGDSTSTYVQITLQFSSFDTNAVTDFTNLQPIIKSQIIALLMSKTAKQLMDPSTHDDLTKSSLTITNQVLNKAANYTPPNPFTAAYITNLVEQN